MSSPKKLIRSIVLLTCLYFILSACISAAGVTVVQSSPGELVLNVHIGDIKITKTRVDDTACVFISAEGWNVQPIPGEPFLPETVTLLAVPPEGDIRIDWRESNVETVPNIRLVTPRDIRYGADKTGIYNPDKNGDKPISVVSRLRTARVGGNRITGLLIVPFRYDPLNASLQIIHDLTVTIRFPPSASTMFNSGLKLGNVIRKLVINPEEARIWHVSEKPIKLHMKNSPWYHADSTWYKIAISEDGIYRITDQIDFSGVDPRTICLFNGGEIVPVYIFGASDGIFDPGDYIEFYGKAYRDRSGNSDKYTRTNVYWLTWRDMPAARPTPLDGSPAQAPIAEAYEEEEHIEENTLYFNKDFYWEKINLGESRSFPIHLTHIARGYSAAKLAFRFSGVTDLPEVEIDHIAKVFINDNLVYMAYWRAWDECRVEVEIPLDYLSEELNQIKVTCPPSTRERDYDTFVIDWFTVMYPRKYRAFQTHLSFSKHFGAETGIFTYRVEGFLSEDIILYRTDIGRRIENTLIVPSQYGYRLMFSQEETPDIHYLAVTKQDIKKPDRVWKDDPSTLRNPSHQADYIIISNRKFMAALDPLVQYRQDSGITVKLVDIEDIYDEFNDGILNPEAIRAFIHYAYHEWSKPEPACVLLVGDASWDYLNQLPTSVMDNDIPSYGKTWGNTKRSMGIARDRFNTRTTSFVYGDPMVDDQFVTIAGEDNLPDLAIGRITPHTSEEAAVIVGKILRYEAEHRDKAWQKNLLFITGGVNDEEQSMFINQSETILNQLILPNGTYWHPVEINKTTDDYSWGIYEDQIIDAIDSGMLLVNFLGHAGSWSWEAMFDFDDISKLNNKGMLPFIGSFTCNTCRFANPEIDSFCEEFLNTPTTDTGCVAAWGGCNFGGFWTDYYLAYYFYDNLFVGKYRVLGDAIMAAKIKALIRYPSYAVIIEPYTYLGDPLLSLNTPSAPWVKMAGLTVSDITSTHGGDLMIWAFVDDPDGLAHVQSVELLMDGSPTGLYLYDDGMNGDFKASDGIYGLAIPIPPVSGTYSFLFGFDCMDIEGNRNTYFPYITVTSSR